jgi:hypothetical protein
MKKTILSLIGFFLLIAGFAQVTLIPKAGITISDFKMGENQENISTLTGLTGGVAVNFTISDLLSVQPEINFIQKGATVDFTRMQNDIREVRKWQAHINYIEVPLLARFTFYNELGMLYLNAGPTFGYGLGGKTTFTYRWEDPSEPYGETTKGNVYFKDEPEEHPWQDVYLKRRTDVGFQFGGGIIFFRKVMLDVRYGLGLTKLDDEAQPQNRTLQVAVGVPITLR